MECIWKNIFQVQPRRLAMSFEPLNSSLPLSAPELHAGKDTFDLVVLVRESLKANGHRSVKPLV